MQQCTGCGREITDKDDAYVSVDWVGPFSLIPRSPGSPDYSLLCQACFDTEDHSPVEETQA